MTCSDLTTGRACTGNRSGSNVWCRALIKLLRLLPGPEKGNSHCTAAKLLPPTASFTRLGAFLTNFGHRNFVPSMQLGDKPFWLISTWCGELTSGSFRNAITEQRYKNNTNDYQCRLYPRGRKKKAGGDSEDYSKSTIS